jgi:hypothetical protein
MEPSTRHCEDGPPTKEAFKRELKHNKLKKYVQEGAKAQQIEKICGQSFPYKKNEKRKRVKNTIRRTATSRLKRLQRWKATTTAVRATE